MLDVTDRGTEIHTDQALRVTVGFRNMWVSGCAMKPSTVTTGHVSTRV